MEDFIRKIKEHSDHIADAGPHCKTEETTKQALILPLLNLLGYNPYDPRMVRAEYGADLPGVKGGERVDYALFSDNKLVMYIEAKPYGQKLPKYMPQLARYFNATPTVCVAAMTNGQEWQFFTDLENSNIMDEKPFLIINFSDLHDADIPELAKFRHGHLKSENMRSLAEDLTYLTKFKTVIFNSLRKLDEDFVRYVARKAEPSMRMNQKNIESMTPIVKKAVEDVLSSMVIDSLSSPVSDIPAPVNDDPNADHVDPDNPNIITTVQERELLQYVRSILGSAAANDDIQARDTASYFNIVYKGMSTRWVLRYFGDKKMPSVQFGIDLTAAHKQEIKRAGLNVEDNGHIDLPTPADIMRLPGLCFDALTYCSNDDNFRRGSRSED